MRLGENRNRLANKLTSSVLSASAGAAIGYAIAYYSLPRAMVEGGTALLGIYGSAGAVAGIVSLRLGIIARDLFSDYRKRSD